MVLASIEDWLLLHGSADAAAIIERLRAARCAEAVVKLDTPACHVMAGAAGEVVIAAEAVTDVIDTTAAGDSFAAAYLAARRAGCPPSAAARAGHRLAGTVVRHRGAIIPKAAMPTLSLTPGAP